MFTIIGADGKEYGPVTPGQIQQWMAENRLTGYMQARRVGESTWQRIRDYPELAGTPVLAAGVPTPAAASTAVDEAGAAAGPPGAVSGKPEPIIFTGEWTEYFKIWIVNVLLTIVTLGIYAAWAKVRKRRYFYSNTNLFGHTFEYLADPVKILYGNLIVAGGFLLYVLLGAFSPLLQLPILILFVIAVPWFIVRALSFNARNTAWRGLRFTFNGTYGGSAAVFLLWPMLVPLTLGFIFPFVARKQKEFVVNHHGYGASPFSFAGQTVDFYKIYGIAALFFLPLVVAYFAFIFMMAAAAMQQGGAAQPPNIGAMGSLGALFLLAAPFAIAGIFYFRSRMFNYVWNNTALAGNQFIASMRARDLFVLHFVNSLVTLLTIGLLHPWAAVRMYKYQMDSLHVLPAGNVDAFVAAAQPQVSAVGVAADDFFDFDLGFGV
jgi:uncharacterized membrane protein YjgN (DUF898 family)